MSETLPGWLPDFTPTVLIVDDTQVSRLYLRQILTVLGIRQIFEATTGARAEDLFLHHKPQLVFLDIQLPDINGNVLLERLQSYQQTSTFYMVSAYSSVDNLKAAIAGGAKGFVVKPYTAERIVKLVQPLLSTAV